MDPLLTVSSSRPFRAGFFVALSVSAEAPTVKRSSRELARVNPSKLRARQRNRLFAGGVRFAAANFFVIVFDSFASLLPPIRILQLAD
jgi:hypothetical protein